MPQTAIRLFRDDKSVPMADWLEELQEHEPKAYEKCLARILLLERMGNELRRPHADMLRNSIRELRVRVGHVNYRILYFFCGANVACLSHGITKEAAVPDKEIDLTIKRKKLVESDLDRHTEVWEQ